MIHAKSGDRDFVQAMENSRFNGFIHSIFDKVLNIQCLENGDLYTIANHKMDNGPNTLVVEIDSFHKLDIAVNDNVIVKDKTLYIENKLAIAIDHAEKWESSLPIYPADAAILQLNVASMKQYIASHGKCGGMKMAVPSKKVFEDEVSRMLRERSSRLISDGLLAQNMPAAVSHAVELVGLGPGLTPSGDDFLVGLFTVLHIPHSPCYILNDFCLEVVAQAKDLTNDISYMALKKASIGKVRQSIICLLHSSLYGKQDELVSSLHEVLAIGSSSGTDIALGIVCGLELNLKSGGRVCQ